MCVCLFRPLENELAKLLPQTEERLSDCSNGLAVRCARQTLGQIKWNCERSQWWCRVESRGVRVCTSRRSTSINKYVTTNKCECVQLVIQVAFWVLFGCLVALYAKDFDKLLELPATQSGFNKASRMWSCSKEG